MLELEELEQDIEFDDDDPVFHLYRAKIPGGWLVLMQKHNVRYRGWGYGGITFVPDPDHEWDGSSID
jgi:hypothetical protein